MKLPSNGKGSGLWQPAAVVLLISSMLIAFANSPARAEIVTDLKGRAVSLTKPAERLVVDDGRMILALSFLSADPVALIAAWPHDIDRFGRELYASYVQKFPQLDRLPKTTSNAQDMMVEQIIAARPDLVVLSTYSHPAEAQLRQLDAAGIPVIFVDFVSDPLVNTDKSLEILGKATGHTQAAERIVELRAEHRAMIARRIGAAADHSKPAMLMETHASSDEPCCNSPGAAGIGKFMDLAGARNIGDILHSKPFGQLNREYIVASKPQVYVATGGEYMKNRGGLLIGPHFNAAETDASLQSLLQRPGFSTIPANDGKNAHGMSQQLFNSPLDILALELLAKWSHPALFSDIDVEATRQQLNALSAVPLSGTYWTE
ncbi:ABC transporter substrate-binding protein [Rhizobium altiplani]|uniref:ABC transporter substrate-binding protein n=1 Tax=Rhizobium altiplani TaxID=1864509 RepID=A0A125Q5D9_9HYPH|nr:ABC transporter substrate-binding protein [Rhizobium altiplani]KWV44477.1 ABC transporter substrate-binding protein [Rhizobium altiplani]